MDKQKADSKLKAALAEAIAEEQRPPKENMFSLRLPSDVYERLVAGARKRHLGVASLTRALVIAGLDALDDD